MGHLFWLFGIVNTLFSGDSPATWKESEFKVIKKMGKKTCQNILPTRNAKKYAKTVVKKYPPVLCGNASGLGIEHNIQFDQLLFTL